MADDTASAVQVRAATSHDLPPLAELFDGYRVFYRQPSDIGLARDFLADRMRRGESVVFVAVVDDRLVGFAQLYPTFSSVAAKRAWVLNDLFVSPDRRRRGVGEALLARVRDHAIDTDAAWVTLSTAVDNVAAQSLYRRFGFDEERQYLTFNHALSRG